MPIFLHQDIEPQGELGIWQIEESEEWFLRQMTLAEAELAQFQKIRGRRRLEWLASRYLVHQMSGRAIRGAFIKDGFGKPHLEDSKYQISISHSWNLAAAIAGPMAVGIDIQRIVSKIERIAHKYMREEEMQSLQSPSRLEHLHLYWSAKEALYKAYGRRKLDFRAHILIEPFDLETLEGSFMGQVVKEDYRAFFRLHYSLFNGHVLVYGVEA